MDDTTNQGSFIFYDQEHLLLIKALGSKFSFDDFLAQSNYANKETFINSFHQTFGKERNLIDIYVKKGINIEKLIKNSLINDLISDFEGKISLNLKENGMDISILADSK